MTAGQKVGLTFIYLIISFGLKILLLAISPEQGMKAANSDGIDEILRENGAIILFFMGVVMAPILEELFFRGLVYHLVKLPLNALVNRLGAREATADVFSFCVAAIVSSLAFALAHEETSVTIFLCHAISGLFLAHLLYKTKSLVAPIGMHALNNAIPFTAMIFLG